MVARILTLQMLLHLQQLDGLQWIWGCTVIEVQKACTTAWQLMTYSTINATACLPTVYNHYYQTDQLGYVGSDLSQFINHHAVVQSMLYVASYCKRRVNTIQLSTHSFQGSTTPSWQTCTFTLSSYSPLTKHCCFGSAISRSVIMSFIA